MTSWRDGASRQAQDDLDELLGVGLEFARQQLRKHGEFFPYAAAVNVDGEGSLIAGVTDFDDDRPDSLAIIELCYAGIRERRDELRAAVVVADVLVNDGDAISLQLEHAEGIALAIFQPYGRKRLGRIGYGDLVAQPGEARIWT